ncbi:unnamed protein product [Rotaria sp. Silwood1]|nr:unnamed protein product [Rotaria sp. Silwood1]CAF3572785.1 unnamed protein product [Rotaria sp. Silwood1]CAF3827154.1 unnamed protein product [Rotaria sp. Silwood1]CAF4663607.1 unnamed protein product [Rotaria sp. Silwood1]CAF4718709.1 unnamed protein product [Rotaria sp. Silwood1]
MKLMFFPVTIIEELPHILLYYNFSRKQDRYFLSPYEVEICKHGSQRTVCDIIRSSDFLCCLLDIDRRTILKQMSTNINSTNSTTMDNNSSPTNFEKSSRRALSCSTTPTNINSNDLLLEMIEQRLDFKHRFCALDVDHNSSVLCNAIGYPNILIDKESTNEANNNIAKTQIYKMHLPHRQYVHQWICIRDIVNGLITCNHTIKCKSINEILIKMDIWLKQRNESKNNQLKSESSITKITNIKIFKAKARQLVWDLMEMKNEVRFPRPSHGRIPNFRYCELAAENVTSLDCFQRARVIKINPSLAQEPLRYLTLTYNKVLLTPTPALESVLFYKLDPKFLRRNQLEWAATKPGAAELGTVIHLTTLKQIHVDLVIVASVVVNPITGARIGKGKGYADLEYAIMSQMGCVTNKTIVITTCHESQLINDLPNNVMEQHDLPVDIIVTPKRYIYTKRLFPRPERVYWNKLDPDMILNIPVLQELKQLEEQDIIKQ